MSKVVPRAGAPIAEIVDDATRQQLEALRDDLAQQAKTKALDRPRDDAGRFAPVPRDTLVRDNKTLQRMRDITAAAGDRTVGWLLDTAQVPSVTQLTKKYSTQASRAPLLSMIAGKGLGPQEAAVLGTTSRLGTGGALVPYKPHLPAVQTPVTAPAAKAEVSQAPLQIEYKPTGESSRAQQSAGPDKKPTWWDSLKSFGRGLVDSAKSAWTQLKSHPLVASVMGLFVGKGYGPAHASMQGANPPAQPARGAPMNEVQPEPPARTPPPLSLPAAMKEVVRAETKAADAVIHAEAPFVEPSADLPGAVKNLQRLWPEGVDRAPEPFNKQAAALQAYKQEGLQKLGDSPDPHDVSLYLGECDLMHGAPGHSQNVARLADRFFSDKQVGATLRSAPGFSSRVEGQVRAAAPWLSLGDVETPVALLAGQRKLTGGEVREHLVPRGARAAELFDKLQLGGGKTGALLSGYRELDPERPLGSQLVRLIDDTAALAAQPSCRRGEQVDPDALAQRLEDNAADGAYHPELAGLMASAARRGLVDQALR